MDTIIEAPEISRRNGTRPATGVSLSRAERSTLAFAIEAGNSELPPNMAELIQHAPESFDDLRHGNIGSVIRTMREQRQPVSFLSVADLTNDAIFVFGLGNDALPLEMAEMEAESQLAAYQVRRAKSIFDEAAASLGESPEQSRIIVGGAIRALNDLATEPGKDNLSVRTPAEILSMTFDNSDRILGDRLLAKGQSLVIAGQGGLGKSRLLLQFIAAQRAGLPFIGFDTRQPEMTWLVLQAENSNRRLQQDLSRLRAWIGEQHWPRVQAGIYIHTLESETDNFLSLDDERTQARIRELLTKVKPDGIAWDSLFNFGIGNLSSDEDMTGTLLAIARLSKAGNPERAIVVLHHALTGKAGAARATGFDRASFGRNSKVLHQWTRGQINFAPGQPDSNDVLVVSCGKCSNGKEFSQFAVRLDPETMIYTVDESFDLSAWQKEVTGKRTESDLSPARVAGIVAELCKDAGAPKKSQIVKALCAQTNCATSGAYKAIKRAQGSKTIHYSKGTKSYVA